MGDVLEWLESSALGTFVRESSLWTYPFVNLFHVLGIAALFGAVLIVDLRLLGVWRGTPLRAVTTVATPVAAAGFGLAATSGVCLLAANASQYESNPVLLTKFSAIALALANAVALRSTTAWRSHRIRDLNPFEAHKLALIGAVSLVSWVTAVAAGRMIAYW